LSCEQLTFNILTNPEEQRITVLPEAFKKLAEQEIIKHINFLQSFTNSNKLINKWKDTIKFMNSRNESNFLKKFFKLTDDKDKIRNQKFEEFFPEYKNLRNYV
jgi:sulfatase maturation enzyme AslB (radical SAM superfamily)